ncbi:phage tail tape measure protein [Actinoplanes sp. CA-252034]|uniref:phage tail tape measure protein n=1 Tax=Actinoplanes sp. CA-252034 TaxID=3239906 RepID=UPI003D98098A
MALKLGELVAYLKADDTALDRGLKTAHEKLRQAGEQARQYAPMVGGALAAGIGAGLVEALNVDAAKTKLAAQLGGDAQYAADMGRIAGNVYGAGFGQSLEAVNETLRGVLGSGLIAEDAIDADIEAITVKAQALADVFGQDVTQTIRAAGQLVRTGLAANAAEAFDIITRGFQQTGDMAGDLLETYSEYGTQFRKLGLDGATATGLLSQGLKAGARDLDIVADAFKEFSIRAVDGSKTTSEGFKMLGLDAGAMAEQIGRGGDSAKAGLDTVLDRLRGIKDPVLQSQAAVALFGTQAEDLGQALFALDPSKATAALGDVAGAADQLGKTVEESASHKLEALKRQVQGALVEKLGQAVPHIMATFGWLKDNSGWVTPLAIGLGILATAIGTVVVATKIWTAVHTAFGVVMTMTPVGLLIIGIGLIVAGILLLATKTKFFQTIWNASWGGIKSAASAVGSWFKDILWAKWIQPAWTGITSAGAKTLDWFNLLPGRLKSALSKVAGYISAPFRSAFNAIASFWNNSVGNINFSVPGWVPGIGGNSFSLPTIPMLAKGGIVPATRGGRLVGVAEGGEAEAVAPLSKLAAMIREAVRGEASAGESSIPEVHVYVGDRELTEIVDVRIQHRDRQVKRRAGAWATAAAR